METLTIAFYAVSIFLVGITVGLALSIKEPITEQEIQDELNRL